MASEMGEEPMERRGGPGATLVLCATEADAESPATTQVTYCLLTSVIMGFLLCYVPNPAGGPARLLGHR